MKAQQGLRALASQGLITEIPAWKLVPCHTQTQLLLIFLHFYFTCTTSAHVDNYTEIIQQTKSPLICWRSNGAHISKADVSDIYGEKKNILNEQYSRVWTAKFTMSNQDLCW